MAALTRGWWSLTLVIALGSGALGCGAQHESPNALLESANSAPGAAGAAADAPEPAADPETPDVACEGTSCPCTGERCNPLELVPAAPLNPEATGSCDVGSSDTEWASSCQSSLAQTCVPGTFPSWGLSSPEN